MSPRGLARLARTPSGHLRLGGALVVAALFASTAGAADEPRRTGVDPEPLDQPVAVSAVRALLYARPFTLRQPFVYTYLRERPAIKGGFLIVLAVDPEIAKPRQVDVPVLYAGGTPVHLTNTGYPSGRLVVIVPDWVDVARDPLFFGSTELPERVDRARGAREAAMARGRAAVPFAAEARTRAFAGAGKLLRCKGSVELFRAVADLIDRYAPEEHELADNYRTPLLKE